MPVSFQILEGSVQEHYINNEVKNIQMKIAEISTTK